LIVELIAMGASYSQTLSNEKTNGISRDTTELVVKAKRDFQIPMNCVHASQKVLRVTPTSGAVASIHSAGSLFGLSHSAFGAGSDSNIATSCNETPALAGVFNSLGIVPSVWPVLGRVTSRFGERRDPFSGKDVFHGGLDIASQYGDAIRATADGVVEKIQRGGSYGLLVVIDHGFGVVSWYGHLSKFAAELGEHIRQGEIIGYEGHSGRATGTHLHYELRIDNTPVNPLSFLSRSQLTTAGD
jgi:murein DD-endopeptidase MepM/ murein hydrolase activator NlpD